MSLRDGVPSSVAPQSSSLAACTRPRRLGRWPLALRSRRGTTTVEFAIIGGGLITAVVAILEVAIQLATVAALEWTTLRASRFAITGGTTVRGAPTSGPAAPPGCRSAMIPWLVTHSTSGFLKTANLTVNTEVFSDIGAGVARTGGTTGAGGGGAIVGYALSYRQPFMTPLPVLVTGRTELTHRTTLVIKNEPFDNATC